GRAGAEVAPPYHSVMIDNIDGRVVQRLLRVAFPMIVKLQQRMLMIGNQGEAEAQLLLGSPSRLGIVSGDGYDPGSGLFKLRTNSFQLHELVAAKPSGIAPVENQNQQVFLVGVAEGESLPLGIREGEIRDHLALPGQATSPQPAG